MNRIFFKTFSILFVSAALTTPIQTAAQPQLTAKSQNRGHHHYKLIDLGTLGGPNSSPVFGGVTTRALNSRGTVAGEADTSTPDPIPLNCGLIENDCLITHAVKWQNGVAIDLGTLADNTNSVASWINSDGWVSGYSENGVIDPLTGYPETFAVLWRDGKIIQLGTLGGNASGAQGVNDKGQVVGVALNIIPDPFSAISNSPPIFETYGPFFFPVATEGHAFLWQNGVMKDLGTLGGPDSTAWFINQHGQIAGQSSINYIANSTTGIPTVDPFFWEDGKMVDIGNLGGTYGFVAALSDQGHVTGTMFLPGDVIYHPFLWHRGVLKDLGTFGGNDGQANLVNNGGEVVGWATDSQALVFAFLWKNGVLNNLGTVDGDPCSAASGINAKGQVVGESTQSCFGILGTSTAEEAFLWEYGGPAVDLNKLVPSNSGLELVHASLINDRGEITGEGILPNGDSHGFLLIPCDEDHQGIEGCDYSQVDTTAAAQVRPGLTRQAKSFTLSVAKLPSAEKMTRIRSLAASRNRRYGMPHISPQ